MDRRNALMGLAAMAGMGGLNPKPLNAPPAGPLSLGIQPGALTGVFTRLIVSASGAFTGIFVYSPSPGAGNLVDSMAAAPGTDPFGNAYVQGIVTYASATSYAQLLSAVLNFQFSPTNRWQLSVGNLPNMAISDLVANRSVTFIDAVGTVTLGAQQPGTAVQETWHNLTLNAGVFQAVAGFHTPRFQFEAINGGRTRLSGICQAVGNQVAGTLIATIGLTAYRPTASLVLATVGAQGGVNISTAGAITCAQAVTGGNSVGLDGLTFELD